ncbi:MAG TPA: PAS domain S-box protein [Gaiellaceae bacterium]|nr:PAS domain S-box protein [Gaiellaceae bacterium]
MTYEPRPGLEVAALSGAVDAVMRGIVERLMELPETDGACLSTVEAGIATFAVALGADEELAGRRIPLADTLGALCVDAGDLVVLRSHEAPEVERCLTPGAGTIVLVPLEWDGEIQGILGMRSASPDAFDATTVEHVHVLASGASIALRNAQIVEQLAARERHYRELHDGAADPIVVLHPDGTIVEANDAASAMLWRSQEELRGLHITAILDADDVEATPLRLDEIPQHGELRGERPVIRKDAVRLVVEYSCRFLETGRIHVSMRDITRRRRREEILRSSLERLHEIVRTQQDIAALELDHGAITRTLVERTQRLTGADGASIYWFEGEQAGLREGSGHAAPHTGLHVDRRASLTALAAATGETIYCRDTHDDPRVDRAASAAMAARSLIAAPLYRDGLAVGVLGVMGSEPDAFDELAVETTRLMAEFVSTVMRNAAELETRQHLVDQLRTQGQVVENMQTGLWVWTNDGGTLRLDYANTASEAATGLPRDEIVGKTILEVFPALDPELIPQMLAVVEAGQVYDPGDFEYGDTRVRPSVFSFKAFPLADGRIAVAFDNVTENARAQRALSESESRFRSAFDSSAVGMALTALDTTFVQVNARLAEMLGYTPAELMRLSVSEITHPDDLGADLEYIGQMQRGECDHYTREKRYIRKDGSILWGELTVSLVRGYDGTPTHVVSHIHDVTAQRETALLFEATFERSIVPIMVLGDDRRIVEANEAAIQLLQVTYEEALTLRVDDLVIEEPIAEFWDAFMEAGTIEAETWIQLPNGSRRRIEYVATADVRPGRHIAVVRDLTKQKELEAQLRQAQKMEAVGRLAGGIAHDFNNLLTAIAGYSEFLIAGQTEDKLRRHAQEIKKAADRAAALTGQLLAFSRRQVLQPRVLDLNSVVSDMDMMLRRLIGEDVELVTMLDPALAPVLADPTQVEQVIVNLAVNARDAMPQGGSVTIETSNVRLDDGELVELRLTDTGVGMTETERQQLFDPFFTTKEFGTGLGLATVYGIVEQSGGTIDVDSAPGHGSSFRILLPATAAPVEEREAQQAQAPETGEETILLVEDEAVVRQLVAEILETSGYSVLPAGDGPSALEILRRHNGAVDLLVTDVVMPGMSGPEVATAVTAMRPGTQVLYISGYTDQAIGHHGVLEPGIAFLQKPFSADDLARKVRNVLDGAVVGVD